MPICSVEPINYLEANGYAVLSALWHGEPLRFRLISKRSSSEDESRLR
jgi:hypothetical protein